LLFKGRQVFVDVEDANGYSVAPLVSLLPRHALIVRVVVGVIFQLVNPLSEPVVGVDAVENDAGLEDINQRIAFVLDASGNQVGEVFGVTRKATSNEGSASSEGDSMGLTGHSIVPSGEVVLT